jgi:tRNA(Arg) A34 adenosine deaminase TadA
MAKPAAAALARLGLLCQYDTSSEGYNVQMNRGLPKDTALIERFLDVVEADILPMTEEAVRIGNKIFGAAILRKSDRSLVLAASNNETENPLWHGEVHALKQFYELPASTRPDPKDCLFIATHEPCSLCLSAITWTGFDNFYFLFSHEDSRTVFNIPHDSRILKEVFSLDAGGYNTDNAYWTSYSIAKLVASQPLDDRKRLQARIDLVTNKYSALSRRYDMHKDGSSIPLR